MSVATIVRWLIPLLSSTAAFAAPQTSVADSLRLERLFAVTSDGGNIGAAVQIRGGPPWRVHTLATTEGGRRLRRFARQLYVVHEAAGTVWRIPENGGWIPQVYDFGPGSEPQDVHVPTTQLSFPPKAYLTRRNDPHLFRFDLTTGLGGDVVDLSPVGGEASIALGTMERDGGRLFVQVRVFDSGAETALEGDSGVLAVVDLATHTLVDADPSTPGIQGVALQGAPPRLKMQILPGTRTLFVSTTDGILDSRGGIEMVDLDALVSTGFALSEQQTADMGGFVMTAPDEGFFVFHTDLLASTHLKRFTIAGGPDPGPEMIVLLHDTVDVLAHDPVLGRVFLPSGFSSAAPGIYVFDAVTKEMVGDGPIDTGMKAHDVLVARTPSYGASTGSRLLRPVERRPRPRW